MRALVRRVRGGLRAAIVAALLVTAAAHAADTTPLAPDGRRRSRCWYC